MYHSILNSIEYGGAYGSTFRRTNGDGDGTVNIRSLRGCLEWENDVNQNGHPIYHHDLEFAEHYEILKDNRAINYVLTQAIGDNFVQPNITSTESIYDYLKEFKFKYL